MNVLQSNMAQARVGNVANEDPSNLEDTLPLIRCPDGAAATVIDLTERGLVNKEEQNKSFTYSRQHLGHATEVAAIRSKQRNSREKRRWGMQTTRLPCVHTEKEIYRPPACVLLERLVQPLVPRIRGAPDLIFERLVDVILRV